MQVIVQNLAPDCDCINITVGPNNDVVICVDKDEHGDVFVTVSNNSTGESDRRFKLGEEGQEEGQEGELVCEDCGGPIHQDDSKGVFLHDDTEEEEGLDLDLDHVARPERD